MTWYALGFTILLLLCTIALAVKLWWPRHRDGRMWSIDEFIDWIDEKIPTTPIEDEHNGKIASVVIIMVIATIAVAISKLHKL